MVQEYLFPATVSEAVALLASKDGKARIIAGGTDLVLDMKDGKFAADVLLDLSNIGELSDIAEADGYIRIGANVTLSQVVNSKLVHQHAPALVQACRKVGSLQIRNVATVVGNVVTANPAADAAVALACLDTSVEVVDQKGLRVLPLAEMYAGICLSGIDSCNHLVTHLKFPLKEKGDGCAYVRMEQRKALSLPMLNVSAKVSVKDGCFAWARVLFAPVGAGPQHAIDAELFLQGAEITDANIKEAGLLARNQATFRSSAVRGSKEYRMGVLPAIVERVLQAAVADAGQA
ncbi:FAD binding domain-containing protein [Desulfotalea psychrophila]|uniref:Related to aerobic-type carbon monoxide dehydrogenase, medium subunit n=1 Tax=Desulfotalea psychrophila (strain LSv54 / DSM 12343) TaxID=177439 RepID=Q6AK64_DESPS|nr:FAD binding domain-containing protein [Desulfotalea psychrophila]CAG37262.1 related to aerobic-type carbon monoxide dehydrogenase, medium subunit [Desulfotalea psychrophila LSv54]